MGKKELTKNAIDFYVLTMEEELEVVKSGRAKKSLEAEIKLWKKTFKM